MNTKKKTAGNTSGKRISHREFFLICEWLKNNLLAIPSGKTTSEIAIIFSENEELKTAGVRFPIPDGSVRQICLTVGYQMAKIGQYPRGKVKSQHILLFRKRLEEVERKIEVLIERLDYDAKHETMDDVLKHNEAKDEEKYYAEKARDEEAAKDAALCGDTLIEAYETNLISEEQLDKLDSCQSADEWSLACKEIKEVHGGGYPSNWWDVVKESGMMKNIMKRWGASDEIQVSTPETDPVEALFDMKGTITKDEDEEDKDGDYEPPLSITASPEVQELLEKYNDEEDDEEDMEFPDIP